MYIKFQSDWSMHMQVIANFAKCAKRRIRRKNEELFSKVWLLVSWEWLRKSSHLEFGLAWVEGTSTVNLVPFGTGITELWMHKNHYFVVSVNILTPFACAPFSWGCTTHYCVSWLIAINKWLEYRQLKLKGSGRLCMTTLYYFNTLKP